MAAGPVPMPNAIRPNATRSGGAAAAGFQWTLLPAEGRADPPPPMPPGRRWSAGAKDAWASIWQMPQAVAWDQSGKTLHSWILLWVKTRDPRATSLAPLLGEMRQIEDRHGFSPKAMLQLRWRIVADEVAERRPSESSARERLHAVVAEG